MRRAYWGYAFKLALGLFLCAVLVRSVHWKDRVVDQTGKGAVVVARAPSGYFVKSEDTAHTTYLHADSVQTYKPGIRSVLSRVNPGIFALAVSAYIAGIVIVGGRWLLLLRSLDSTIRLSQTLLWQVQATAMELVGLGQIGYEAARATIVIKKTGKTYKCLGIQVLERCVGMFALALLVAIGARISEDVVSRAGAIGEISVVAANLILMGLSLAVLAAMIMPPTWRSLFQKPAAALLQRKALLSAVSLSILIHVVTILVHFLLTQSLGAECGISVFFLLVPLVTLATALPISVAGLGVFESAMLLLMPTIAQMTVEEVVALCVLHRVIWFFHRFCAGMVLLGTAGWNRKSAGSFVPSRSGTLPQKPRDFVSAGLAVPIDKGNVSPAQ